MVASRSRPQTHHFQAFVRGRRKSWERFAFGMVSTAFRWEAFRQSNRPKEGVPEGRRKKEEPRRPGEEAGGAGGCREQWPIRRGCTRLSPPPPLRCPSGPSRQG